jgi:hypothetical protein
MVINSTTTLSIQGFPATLSITMLQCLLFIVMLNVIMLSAFGPWPSFCLVTRKAQITSVKQFITQAPRWKTSLAQRFVPKYGGKFKK